MAYKETEDNENVKHWINFYVKSLDEDIKREKLREESEFRLGYNVEKFEPTIQCLLRELF